MKVAIRLRECKDNSRYGGYQVVRLGPRGYILSRHARLEDAESWCCEHDCEIVSRPARA